MEFSPDGTRLATASHDTTARVWDAASGELIATLQGHKYYLVALTYSPDGTRIVTASQGGNARVWDAASGESITTLQGHEDAIWALTYSPDSTFRSEERRVGKECRSRWSPYH